MSQVSKARAVTGALRPHSPDRAALVSRWFELTRDILPMMSARQRCPIRFDHCFMRVCLDEAVGAPWTRHIARPAIGTMSDDQLRQAVAIAEGIVAEPDSLRALNEKSLLARRATRRTAGS